MSGKLDEPGPLKYFGTPAYMPPEVITQSKNSGGEIDIWSLGIIVYHMLFGKLPFIDCYWVNYMLKIVNDPLTFPSNTDQIIDPLSIHFLECLLYINYIIEKKILKKGIQYNKYEKMNI